MFPVLDLNAPGVNIVSCGISGLDAQATMSGTSMGKFNPRVALNQKLKLSASPHIAGLAACLRQNLKNTAFTSLAYELRLRAEGGCKPYTGHEAGTPNLAAVNNKV
jgi:subtilisin family serine protease